MSSSLLVSASGRFSNGQFFRSGPPTKAIQQMFVLAGAAYAMVENRLYVQGTNTHYKLGLGHDVNVTEWTDTGLEIEAIFMPYNHGAAIKKDGNLWLAGGNASATAFSLDRFGNGGADLPNWTDIGKAIKTMCLQHSQSALVTPSGALEYIGYNQYGQAGDGTIAHKTSWAQTVASGVERVSIGNNTFIEMETGPYRWTGRDRYGSAGVGAPGQRSTFINGPWRPTQVENGPYHSIAIYNDQVYVAGSNGNGQMGFANGGADVNTWTLATLPGGAGTPIKVDAWSGLNASVVLCDNGRMYGAGSINGLISASAEFVDLGFSSIVDFFGGLDTLVAIDSSGAAWVTGVNTYGAVPGAPSSLTTPTKLTPLEMGI